MDNRSEKKHAARIAAWIMMLSLILTSLSGCSLGFRFSFQQMGILQVGKYSCSRGTAALIAASYQKSCENSLGQQTAEDIWKEKISEKQTYWQYIRDRIVLEELYCALVLCNIADEQGIVLTPDETQKIDQAAAAYFANIPGDMKKELTLDIKDVQEAYKLYYLSEKCIDKLSEGVSPELSEEASRVIELKEYLFDTEENARSVYDRIENGEDVSRVLTDIPPTSLCDSLTAHGERSAVFEENAFRLQKGAYAPPFEDGGNWYLLYCVEECRTDLSEQNREKIYREQRYQSWEQVCADWAENRKFFQDESQWKKIEPVKLDCEWSDFFYGYEELQKNTKETETTVTH